MRILYISQYFPPEVGATQNRAYEMATHLVRMGHQVTMLTEVPNHPKGIIHAGYRRKLVVRETLAGVEVVRVWVVATPRKTFLSRLGFYLSFAVLATAVGVCLRRRYDVVIHYNTFDAGKESPSGKAAAASRGGAAATR